MNGQHPRCQSTVVSNDRMLRRTISSKSSCVVHSRGGLISVMRTTDGFSAASVAVRYFPPLPHNTQSGLIRFFSKSFTRHSAGICLRFLASAMDDWRISRNAASSTWVLHSAASKTRWYWASKAELLDGCDIAGSLALRLAIAKRATRI